MSIRLQWHQVRPDEWQAGGIGSFYQIKFEDGVYRASHVTGDKGNKRPVPGVSRSLEGMQQGCQVDLDSR